jgi:N-acyl-D-amino-acid deacylase
VVQGDRIVALVPPGDADGATVFDLEGLVLAPGFIDIHTHLDAQVLWDPDLTPSSWHGVTSVVVGNCGFGVAPVRRRDRRRIIRTLEGVEGMSAEALQAGIDWAFETFPEYLSVLEHRPKRLNVGALIGHSPLRYYVLGAEATEREATIEEMAQMRALVEEALDAGALGFSTSRNPNHLGEGGRPVPSVFASPTEVFELARGLGARHRGMIQFTSGPGFFTKQASELALQTGRPVTWTALLTGFGDFDPLRALDAQTSSGGEVWPQMSCLPLVMQIDLAAPYAFAQIPAFGEIFRAPRWQQVRIVADQTWRDLVKPDLALLWGERWDKTNIAESVAFPELVRGPSIAALARQRAMHPFDLLCDLAVADELRTRFRIILSNDDQAMLAVLLRDKRTLLGLSDAGAHASQLCDAGFSTFLLQHWVRETAVLSVESAVWRVSGHPASVLRLADRGRIAGGCYADLVAFDPDTIGVRPLERRYDLPTGASRLVAGSDGIEHVWVNGIAVRTQGLDHPGAHPGRLLRSQGPTLTR